jgi:hypothetical protein
VKKLAVYILLSVYLFAQLKPFAIMTSDFLAHTFWKVQHLSTVHYENGHYHLHSELKNSAEDADKDTHEKSASLEKDYETTAQGISRSKIEPQLSYSLIPSRMHQTPDVLAGFTQINSPPPKS